MNRQVILNVILFVGLVSCLVLNLYQSKEMAYVESNRLLIDYHAMKDASRMYQEKMKIWTANIDTLRSELTLEIEKYNNSKPTMTKREVELNEKLLGEKQKQLVQYQQSIEEKARKEDQEMTQGVLDRVNAYIKKYGESHGYDIILAATDAGNVVYAKEGLNLTDEILEGLNAEYDGQN